MIEFVLKNGVTILCSLLLFFQVLPIRFSCSSFSSKLKHGWNLDYMEIFMRSIHCLRTKQEEISDRYIDTFIYVQPVDREMVWIISVACSAAANSQPANLFDRPNSNSLLVAAADTRYTVTDVVFDF
jgi:hypothetical protein